MSNSNQAQSSGYADLSSFVCSRIQGGEMDSRHGDREVSAGKMYIMNVVAGDRWVESRTNRFKETRYAVARGNRVRLYTGCTGTNVERLLKLVWTFRRNKRTYRVIAYFQLDGDGKEQSNELCKALINPNFLNSLESGSEEDTHCAHTEGTSETTHPPAAQQGSFRGPGGHVIA
ncbi:hypothetical protein EW146_g284 [Bondarzewia mesenterica]|uniref:Uncharacterized protein n=1 Tax=Bondarzewia mesenterica TaxID=1095465 RepID=A0A4S4M7F4_9AGAM|nr:hypothetical protein EW146_g284 [Bondarzewia mesenterica]